LSFILNYLNVKFTTLCNIIDDFYIKRPSEEQLKIIIKVLHQNSQTIYGKSSCDIYQSEITLVAYERII